jgi:hypothetical protein
MDKMAMMFLGGIFLAFGIWFITVMMYDFELGWSLLVIAVIEGAFWGVRHWWKERSSNNDIYVD